MPLQSSNTYTHMDRKIQLLRNPALHLGKSIFRGRLDAEDYVDMGLPSGTKWAASNLDLTTETKLAASPFQYECSFFSWGNIVGHNPVSETAFDYNFGGTNAAAPWYEGQPYGDTPGNTLTGDIPINAEFDAARAILGAPWRTPSQSDFGELIINCIYIDADGVVVASDKTDKRVTVNGAVGLYLQSKTNGNRLFIPASGDANGTVWTSRGINAYYWTRTFYSARASRDLFFSSVGVVTNDTSDRRLGFAIRPVMN